LDHKNLTSSRNSPVASGKVPGTNTLTRLRTFPNLTFVDVIATDLERMGENIGAHCLLPRDALHLAAMQKCDCFDLVSHDTDFDRVPTVRRYTL